MNIWFPVRAARGLLSRRKGPVVRMILVAFAGTLWCVLGGAWIMATWREIETDAAAVQIDLLLFEDVSDRDARQLSRSVSDMPGVASSRLVREHEVWNEFAEDIDVSEDLRSIVTLPRIVRFTLQPLSVSQGHVGRLETTILRRYAGIVRQIVWPRQFVGSIESRRRDLLMLGSAAALLSIVMFLIAVTYSFKAEINVAGGDLRVASLIGANAGWIAMPHFLVSVMAGAIGLFTAFGLIIASHSVVLDTMPWLGLVEWQEIALIGGVIMVLGLMVSWTQSTSASKTALRRSEGR